MLPHPRDPTFKQCVTFGTFVSNKLKIAYSIWHFIGCYGAPLVVMIYCYMKIFLTIKFHSNTNKYDVSLQGSIREKQSSTKSRESLTENKQKMKSINKQIEHLYGEKCDDGTKSPNLAKKAMNRLTTSQKKRYKNDVDKLIRQYSTETGCAKKCKQFNYFKLLQFEIKLIRFYSLQQRFETRTVWLDATRTIRSGEPNTELWNWAS